MKHNYVKTNECIVDPYYQRQKCRSISIVSGNINHLQIFEGVSCWDVFKPASGR